MLCKLCKREISSKFYLHLNGSHKIKKDEYLKMFPEQIDDYENQIPKKTWNEGKTKYNHLSIAKGAEKLREFCKQEEVKKKKSKIMKELYSHGDLLDKETRAKVVAMGCKGWVEKVKKASVADRKKMLFAFTSAGNIAQSELRKNRTPEDYQKLYPWAKGIAVNGNCCFCNKLIIIWVGGKPRPKRRFCSNECKIQYQKLHPNYAFFDVGTRFYSKKMQTEFFLRSKLEVWFATLLEESEKIKNWSVCPYPIFYLFAGRKRKYYVDFLVNEKYLIELKSGYVFNLKKEETEAKLKSAEIYSKEHEMIFYYWQFNDSNMTKNKFVSDSRVLDFFLSE